MEDFNKRDPYLQGDKFKFSVDEISPLYAERGRFNAMIIPDIKSTYFPPYHLRNIKISQDLLEPAFGSSFKEYDVLDPHLKFEFRGYVKQGGTYEVPTSKLPPNLFRGETLVTVKNNLFENATVPAPFDEMGLRGEEVVDLKAGKPLIRPQKNIRDEMFLYCFNVGQGDSFLLITPGGEAFLIDINVYTEARMAKYIEVLKRILHAHGLPDHLISGLIITHKHTDHVRGADVLIRSKQFKIKHFIINLNYLHSVVTVERLLRAAQENIRRWCNVNRRGVLLSGSCPIYVMNPSRLTATNNGSPNINDSSIYLFISYAKNCMHLTGDVSYPIINTNRVASLNRGLGQNGRMLKVAHHGSRTGTNINTKSLLAPSHAFISAGTSRKYRHPHAETLATLRRLGDRLQISKEVKTTVCYTVNRNGINQRICDEYSLSD